MLWLPPIIGLLWPAETPPLVGRYRVTSAFGWRIRNGRREYHTGADIGNGRSGGPVVAMAAGTVHLAGFLSPPWTDRTPAYPTGMGGRMIVLKLPGGWFLVYAHLASIAVQVGQRVEPGDVLGALGDSGSAAGQAHLHVEVWTSATERADPWAVLVALGWPDVLLRPVFEPWTLPVGAKVHLEGPGLGAPETVTVAERFVTLFEGPATAGGWRLGILEDGRAAWVARKSMIPRRPGGHPQYATAARALVELGRQL